MSSVWPQVTTAYRCHSPPHTPCPWSYHRRSAKQQSRVHQRFLKVGFVYFVYKLLILLFTLIDEMVRNAKSVAETGVLKHLLLITKITIC